MLFLMDNKELQRCSYILIIYGIQGVRRRIEIGANCMLNSRLLPSRLRSCTGNCTVREGKLQILVALFQREIFSF